MQKSGSLYKNSSLRIATQQSLRRLGLCSPTATGQQTSPIVFPEKRNSRGKAAKHGANTVNDSDLNITKREEHKIDVADEQSDLLGYEVFSGKLSLEKSKSTKNSELQTADVNLNAVDAKLTSKALIWGSKMLLLDDIVSLSCCVGVRHFTVHAYPLQKTGCGLFKKSGRVQKDFRFFSLTAEDAIQWVNAFADQQCYVNILPHPLASKKQNTDTMLNEFPAESYIRCKRPPKMLVILNPRSGRGRSSKVFHGFVEPIFKLAGFQLEVVKTTSAGHARKLVASIDFSSCPDGIICVGGDGIINEVLNGLLSRDNQKEAISIPIGIIPAGSDNSLVWTVLGVRDPVSAALTIVKGGLTPTDVFAVEWIHTGAIHFGTTVTYFGFISDVLELSEKYQKRFGPLRYFVAGFLKFLCLPKYSYEVEYLPARREAGDGNISADQEVMDMSELYTDIMRRSSKEGLPRASSLSSIDSVLTPSQMSAVDFVNTFSSAEPSEFVRAIDAKSKRLSAGRSNVISEPEVIHQQSSHSVTPNMPRTRSKSRADKGWTGLTTANDPARPSWRNPTSYDKEDISSTLSDPGPIWDSEPRWDAEPNWNVENPVELPAPSEESEAGDKKEISPRSEEKWVVSKGQFLGVLVCNHSCRTVQSLSSQVLAPKAEHDDNTLDLLLVRKSGRLKLLRFLLDLQRGRHVSLPYVEYVKVKSVKVKPGKHTEVGCGIDGELFPVNGQVMCSLLPDQCRLIGRSHKK
ncbi:sphingoid long-chain bases kinase 1-like [Andrographis paniculata]|uniref:sphingoid long-chain bases kinase 1-like n=1 Tax=Andrographis paniculata TaxID=175694 RepID=UPI0021E91372|nr:sphingoid long-chain bases kinase 1-like [Andrographis paniculata]XP_051144609.1 sphingoid long-chain bases kinase 1-like [Andrographis paniculata]